MNTYKFFCANEDLYINKELFISHEYVRHLTHQQRDGIRFLYAQWKKKSHGVILNDPVLHMSLVQAFLFMNAVKPQHKSNLVLCSKEDLGNVNTLFKFWTDKYLFYAHMSQPKFTPDTIYLNLIDSPEKWYNKKWGILIVCCQNSDFYPTLCGVDAEFKILITECDVKTNFKEFADVYKWINPEDKITSEVYKIVNQSFHQKIIFESMLENSVLKRDYSYIPKPYTREFSCNLRNINRGAYFAYFDPSHNRSISKQANKQAKNKDMTGLKIKSSMKNAKQTKTATIPQQKYEDVESFIRNNPPIVLDDNKDCDLETYSHSEIDDMKMDADAEEIFHSMTLEAVARDEGVTAENVEDVVMASNYDDNDSHEDPKNVHGNNTNANEILKNKDNLKTFDASLKAIEEMARKKYKGSLLDSIF